MRCRIHNDCIIGGVAEAVKVTETMIILIGPEFYEERYILRPGSYIAVTITREVTDRLKGR